jgi:hypothetical protein
MQRFEAVEKLQALSKLTVLIPISEGEVSWSWTKPVELFFHLDNFPLQILYIHKKKTLEHILIDQWQKN